MFLQVQILTIEEKSERYLKYPNERPKGKRQSFCPQYYSAPVLHMTSPVCPTVPTRQPSWEQTDPPKKSHLRLARSPGNHPYVAVGMHLPKEGTYRAAMSTVGGRLVLMDQALEKCFGVLRCRPVG